MHKPKWGWYVLIVGCGKNSVLGRIHDLRYGFGPDLEDGNYVSSFRVSVGFILFPDFVFQRQDKSSAFTCSGSYLTEGTKNYIAIPNLMLEIKFIPIRNIILHLFFNKKFMYSN
jgi:hypothetical protein